MIPVQVTNTFLVKMGKEFLVLLKSSEDGRTLPITIGQLEAQSIAIQLNQIPFSRPLTHDLFKKALEEINCRIVRTEICDLKDGTFYAKLVLGMDAREIEIDSRPSDAIAMALRFSAPILVDEKVMDEEGIVIPEEDQMEEVAPVATEQEENEDTSDRTPIDALKLKLKQAIEQERYEDAAMLRDEIDKIAKSN